MLNEIPFKFFKYNSKTTSYDKQLNYSLSYIKSYCWMKFPLSSLCQAHDNIFYSKYFKTLIFYRFPLRLFWPLVQICFTLAHQLRSSSFLKSFNVILENSLSLANMLVNPVDWWFMKMVFHYHWLMVYLNGRAMENFSLFNI